MFVARKFPRSRIERGDLVPAQIDGVPTDVEGVGYVRRHQDPHRRRHRPAPGGVSVSPDAGEGGARSAGTLGVVVVDRGTGRQRYILSNNHVLANENRMTIGAPALQPGALDGGTVSDRIGALSRFVPLLLRIGATGWTPRSRASTARPMPREILEIGRPLGSAAPVLNGVVRKSGRTTGLTEGIIRAVQFDAVNIQYDRGLVAMHDVVVIRSDSDAFSRPPETQARQSSMPQGAWWRCCLPVATL